MAIAFITMAGGYYYHHVRTNHVLQQHGGKDLIIYCTGSDFKMFSDNYENNYRILGAWANSK